VAASADADALEHAVSALLGPLAQLAVSKGMPCAVVEGLLRQAFVNAARDAHPSLAPHRIVSRIATATGLSRREVTRLTQSVDASPRWTSEPTYRDKRGRPRKLPRQGEAPSFETLAHSVTRDVHPRSLLDELVRLGLAVTDPAQDTVALIHDAFVPRGDTERMLGFLGQNVGDHIGAAVANVLADGHRHFEQAVFADGLSLQSVDSMREPIAAHWRAIHDTLVPKLEKLIDADSASGRPQDQRLRVGLFSYSEQVSKSAAPAAQAETKVDPSADLSRSKRSKGAH
jgi:hypothetical protein